VIITAVRWYLRYPLSYVHVAELLAERGLLADASCIWRWVQAYGPELNKRCRPHLKSTRATGLTRHIGYGSFQTAWRTLQGIEAINMIRKGRARGVVKGDALSQALFVEELFGITA
jgi:transposase-like protein